MEKEEASAVVATVKKIDIFLTLGGVYSHFTSQIIKTFVYDCCLLFGIQIHFSSRNPVTVPYFFFLSLSLQRFCACVCVCVCASHQTALHRWNSMKRKHGDWNGTIVTLIWRFRPFSRNENDFCESIFIYRNIECDARLETRRCFNKKHEQINCEKE